MGKTLYFDCFSGASGDMVLGALIDLGLPLEALRAALGSLALDHGTIVAGKVLRAGIAATKFALVESGAADAAASAPGPSTGIPAPESPMPSSVSRDSHAHAHGQAHGHPHSHGEAEPHVAKGHHSLREIAESIDRSALSAAGRRRAKELFARLAEAEAAVHAMPVERVHLHEVGAVDSIVDIVGAVYGLEWLGATRIVSSPLNVGSGTVRCAHGVLPVPAPATTRLLTGVPIYAKGVPTELTTPTGALLVTAYAESFGGLPAMRVTQVGYGAGDKDFVDHPNVLRLMVGDEAGNAAIERIVSIACEIDDMNPQLFGPLMDRLYAAGALDVYYGAVQMKKNRPGTLVTVLASPDGRAAISGVLFAETTTIGVRYAEMDRERLQRQVRSIATPLGPIRFKVATRDGRIMNASPEFEDCARAAAEKGLPIKDVQAIATRAWLEREGVD